MDIDIRGLFLIRLYSICVYPRVSPVFLFAVCI